MSECACCGCVVLRYVTDARRDITIPIGVAVWRIDGKRRLVWRLPRHDEGLEQELVCESAPHLAATRAKIEGWVETNDLPYCGEGYEPLTRSWWAYVAKLLVYRVRIGNVSLVDADDPEAEIERLYRMSVLP